MRGRTARLLLCVGMIRAADWAEQPEQVPDLYACIVARQPGVCGAGAEQVADITSVSKLINNDAEGLSAVDR
jgi:hypothetical protein